MSSTVAVRCWWWWWWWWWMTTTVAATTRNCRNECAPLFICETTLHAYVHMYICVYAYAQPNKKPPLAYWRWAISYIIHYSSSCRFMPCKDRIMCTYICTSSGSNSQMLQRKVQLWFLWLASRDIELTDMTSPMLANMNTNTQYSHI